MKKLMVSTIILLPLLILAIMLVSGAIMSMIVHIYVEKVEFVKSETLVLVMKDESAPPEELLEVNVFPLEADDQDLVFSIEDTDVATVDENGKIKANYYGETFVTVTSAENKAASAKRKVLVTDNSVHAVSIKEFENDIYRGDPSQRLLAEVVPFEANNKSVIWTSSNPSVLSVTSSGDITCRGAGTVTITAASSEKPEIKASVEVRCHEPLQSLSSETSSVVTAETKAQFPKLFSTPENATYSVTYSSSDENIAKTDENGEINFYKAGAVTVTATAIDGRGHEDTVSVKYHCTNGYYMGVLFEKTSYAFDYDEFSGKTLEEIRLLSTPEGSYRKIEEVSCDKEGLISFDKISETFRLNDVEPTTELGLVTVTIRAKKYDYNSAQIKEFVTDVCQINITRHTRNISFDLAGVQIGETNISVKSINLSEVRSGSAASGIGVIADPANHTDFISYSVKGAAHMKNSVLVFDKAGKATVTATAADAKGNVHASADLVVTYAEPEDSDKKIELNSEKEQTVVLTFYDNGAKETGVLELAVPEGTKAVCTSDSDVIKVEEGVRLVPQKGGFATVTVSFEPDSGNSLTVPEPYQIKIYVDKEVLPDDILFSVDDGFSTSKESMDYNITLDVFPDAMEGKKLFVDGKEQTLIRVNNRLQCFLKKQFAVGETNATLSASIVYSDKAFDYSGKSGEICSSDVRVSTTHGRLEVPPKVLLGEEVLSQEETNDLIFNDIGVVLTLTVDASSAVPRDFELSEGAIKFTSNLKFDYEIKVGNNRATLSLTAKEGGTEQTSLQIAGQTYNFNVNVAVLAHTAEISFGNQKLDEKTEYTTLLSSLELTVKLSREDNHTITEKTVSYSFGDNNWTTVSSDGKTCNLKLSMSGQTGNILQVKCGKAVCNLNLKKLGLEELELEYHIEYSDGKNKITFESFAADDGMREYCFPKAIQGNFDICIEKPELPNNLGGYDLGALKNFFELEYPENWSHEVTEEKITVKLPADDHYFLNEEVTLHCGEKKFTLLLNCSDMVRVELPGFNYEKSDDVYLGYQQVRVFAKQSDYEGSGTNTVDYFRIPIKAVKDTTTNAPADPKSILWTFSRVTENGEKVITTQRGNKVTCGEDTYEITKVDNGSSKLTKVDGNVIAENGKFAADAQKITWVDIYANEGHADIYFGDFGGLSESDVQNDYFGNFGEEENWKKTPQAKEDNSGRNFKPSENAYTFLRIEASDGAKNSQVKTHYNFNVLEDKELVNVFNANGYYNHRKVVLHNNLYGPDELTDEPNATDKIINSTSPAQLGKDLIYGNGNQVNFQALNTALVASKGTAENTGTDGITFGWLYNLTLKGTNPADSVDCKTHKIILNMRGAYYSDLQYYSKMDPIAETVNGERKDRIYFKNTVMRYVANAALQLYAKAAEGIPLDTRREAYFENVVIAESMRAISLETGKNNNLYFKGFFDVLNYSNAKGLQDKFGAINGGYMYNTGITEDGGKVFFEMVDVPGIKDAAKDVLEWFGSDSTKNTLKDQKYYINMICTETGGPVKTYHWKNDTYQEDSSSGDIFAKVAIENSGMGVTILTFNVLNTIDGGQSGFTSRTMSELFTDKRDIRLLCQYKTIGSDGKLEKNTDHILWHMQKVYRDVSKIEKRENDHITDLKNSLKDVKWPDGTEANTFINGTAESVGKIISQAIPSSKREYV